MNLTFPQHKKKGWKVQTITNGLGTNEMEGHWLVLTEQIKETVLGVCSFPVRQHWAGSNTNADMRKEGGESNVQNFKDKYNIYNWYVTK